MNYRKTIIYSALSLGFILGGNAQNTKYSLNGLGRSIITNNSLGGNIVEENDNNQKYAVTGYNLFDLQSTLDVDSTFYAKAILRTRSPFGTAFGSKTTFEFRQFSMGGSLEGFEYELGDIRVEMTPFTVYNSDLAETGYESVLFSDRKSILEYENFNLGNSWLLQGLAGQHAWDFGKDNGIGIYAFTARTASTNEYTEPDRLMSGGRLEYGVNKHIKIGINDVYMYDIAVNAAEYDQNINVLTGDFKYAKETDKSKLMLRAEGGFSSFTFSETATKTDSSYSDITVDVDVDYGMKKSKISLGADFRMVGAAFTSPAAQSRRFVPGANPLLFGTVNDQLRTSTYFDQFTDEGVYNNKVSPVLMEYRQYFNSIAPYGKATPNRMVFGLNLASDTTSKNVDAGLSLNYGSELIGEGGADQEDLRTFLMAKGGANVHLGNLLGENRLIDINAGVRFENTSRAGLAEVALTSLLLDAGFALEILNKVDLLGGFKTFSANGNEFIANRDGFNLINSFSDYTIDVNETIISAGLRLRFSKRQHFNVNYNMSALTDNDADKTIQINQLFVHYVGKF